MSRHSVSRVSETRDRQQGADEEPRNGPAIQHAVQQQAAQQQAADDEVMGERDHATDPGVQALQQGMQRMGVADEQPTQDEAFGPDDVPAPVAVPRAADFILTMGNPKHGFVLKCERTGEDIGPFKWDNKQTGTPPEGAAFYRSAPNEQPRKEGWLFCEAATTRCKWFKVPARYHDIMYPGAPKQGGASTTPTTPAHGSGGGGNGGGSGSGNRNGNRSGGHSRGGNNGRGGGGHHGNGHWLGVRNGGVKKADRTPDKPRSQAYGDMESRREARRCYDCGSPDHFKKHPSCPGPDAKAKKYYDESDELKGRRHH